MSERSSITELREEIDRIYIEFDVIAHQALLSILNLIREKDEA